ncbi:MAG: hypothetical protein ACM3XS_04750 [Bacteroidota bacterium]
MLSALVLMAMDRVREGWRALTGQAPPPIVAVSRQGDRFALRIYDLRLAIPYPRRALRRLIEGARRRSLGVIRGAPVGWPGRLEGP